jgi:hypothetical protein
MIGFRSGEKLPFLLDTGAPVTCLETSLEPRLGKRLGTTTASNFGAHHEANVYEAPKLYLGNILLTITGTNVITFDFKRAPPKLPRPYVGILGMHVLLNYCIQLDFAARQLRFLDGKTPNRHAWGKPFPLTDVGDGCVAISENLAGAKDSPSLIDTGYRGDGFLTLELFQRWTNHVTPSAEGEARVPDAVLGGEIYSDVQLEKETLLLGDPPRQFNGIGLYLLSRHVVTFDFPNHTMYLKRTSSGPVVDKDSHVAAEEAVTFLHGLQKKGQLPGWSRKDEFASKSAVVQLPDLNSANLNHILKKGDSSIYHFELTRAAQNRP